VVARRQPADHLAALYARRVFGEHPQFRRERWATPDGDFVDLDLALTRTREARPLLVLFPRPRGSSRSHYAEAFADFAAERGLAYVVPHFRGCSGELNQGRGPITRAITKRSAGSWPAARAAWRPAGRVGVSLGGNALMRWAGEAGEKARKLARRGVGLLPAGPGRRLRRRSGVASTGWSTPRCSCAA
jgi:predicted alpha/beta-fold hydrolase